jgi:hypothetical protein
LETFVVYIIPLFYLLAGLWLILSRTGRVSANFSPLFIVGFVGLKAATGLLYTWVMLRFIPAAAADIDLFFGDGLEMYRTFWRDPSGFSEYLKEQFHISDFQLTRTDSDFIRTVFEGIKFIHFALNFMSGGELFTNVLLFNLLAAFLFLRCWAWMVEKWKSIWPGIWLFLFPSAFFFTSVILKEGIEWCLIAAILPALDRFLKKRRLWQIPGLVLLFSLLFFFKYLIAATFCGALVLYNLFLLYPQQKFAISITAVILSILLFFNAKHLHPALNFPAAIIERRMEFSELEANTAIDMRTLTPDAGSFLKALPEALRNIFLRPLPGEEAKVFYLVFSLEMFFFWAVMGWMVYRIFKTKFFEPTGFAVAITLFSLANLLIIGYTITNTGAIIRYRSIFLPGILLWFWPYGWHYLDARISQLILKK